MRHLSRRSATAILLYGAAAAVLAQDFPARTVRIIVPYAAGTGVDLAARILAEQLTKTMGQPFVVENRIGAAGTIAGGLVASAPPDGHTLLTDSATFTTMPSLMKLPYDAQRDLIGVAMMGSSPLVFVSSRTAGYQSIRDLVAAAKAKPGTITLAAGLAGTSTHIAAEKFRVAAGIQAVHVPYKSTTDGLTDTMSGRVDVLVTTLPSALAHVKEGRLVALATGQTRAPALPNVPTLAEAGIANAEAGTWFGLFAPARTPRAIVARLNAETVKAMGSPEVRERLGGMGAEPSNLGLDEFNAQLKREFVENEQLIKAAGIKLQ